MSFNQDEFDQFILENNVVGIFDEPIQLKSGQTSHWYVNWRQATNQAETLLQLAQFVNSFIDQSNLTPDSIIGVPEGATKVAIATTLIRAQTSPGLSVPVARGASKSHGHPKDRYFIGEPKGRTVVIEDVTTTGGSIKNFLDVLHQTDVEVVAAICLTNRMSSKQLLQDTLGCPVFEMSQGQTLVRRLVKKNPDMAKRIENERISA